MLQGEGVDAEIEGNGTNTRLCSILVDKPTNLDECIEKCEKIACQYESLTKKDQTMIIKYLVFIFALGDSLLL